MFKTFCLYLVLNKEVKELPNDYYHLINQFNDLSSHIKNLISLSFKYQQIGQGTVRNDIRKPFIKYERT